ncbi:hypothetical protein QQZ08_011383 [Neonectria magnoliae]|uniref:Uncharacterized protein n=1 Tax=Neonectria magnoliae TaxID=2732573 RepID=A0ABR1HC30_9HYPO
MLLKILLFGATLPVAVVQAASSNCASFWPSINPGERNTVNGNCQTYPDYPKIIGQTKVTVVYTDEWQGNLGIINALLNEAITQSVAVYSALTPPPDIVLILDIGRGPNEENYEPDKLVWQQANRYVPSLWFQSLERSRGIVYLHQFVMSTIFAASGDEERARLSSISGFIDDFYLFALQFSFDLIVDTSGKQLHIQNAPEYKNTIWSVNNDASEGTAVLEIAPFTISGFTLKLDVGQNVKLYAYTTAKQRIAWRRKGDFTGIVFLKLARAVGRKEIRVLVVSGENKSSDGVQVQYTQAYKDDNCCKQNPKKREAEECPTSSASSSTATSSAAEPTDTGTGSGSCSGSNIAMDRCLLAHSWNLDISSTRELMRKQLTKLPNITINVLDMSGSGGLDFDKKNVTFTYSSLTTKVDFSVEGVDFPVNVVIDGEAEGWFFIKSGGSGSGVVCFAYTMGSGTVRATGPFAGEQVFDLVPGGAYLQNMDTEYTCSNGRVTIASAGSVSPLDAAAPWSPLSYNAA